MSDGKNLRTTGQPGREPFFWARLYGRRLSWPVTLLVLRTPLSANAITIISIVMGAIGGLCFAAGSLCWDIVAVALLLASWILDCVDGEVARIRGTASLDGEFIDACRHQIVAPAIFIGLALGVHVRHPESFWLLAMGFSSAVLSVRFTGGMIDQMVLEGVRRAIRSGRASGPPAASWSPSDSITSSASGGCARAKCQALRNVRALFVDFNILHILMVAVALDGMGLHLGEWTTLDAVYVAYGVAFPIVKLGSMAMAWRRGVSGRVEEILRGADADVPHH